MPDTSLSERAAMSRAGRLDMQGSACVECAHKVLATLRIWQASTSTNGSVRTTSKRPGYGTGVEASLERADVQSASKVSLGQRDGTRGVLRLIRRFVHVHAIFRAGGPGAKRHDAPMRSGSRSVSCETTQDVTPHAAQRSSMTHWTSGTCVPLTQNHEATRLDDRRLLARDLPERVTQNTRMVEADARDRDGNGSSRSWRPAPAQADLEHRHVNAGLREHHHRRHGQQVERRDRVG